MMSAGLAIHIGMNRLDPAAYAGWDGALDASENDARAMADLTRGLGYRRRLLLSADATASAVFAAISSAAAALDGGDIFILTYAGHGGQLSDLSGDETDSADETWLLYDREVLDDEISAALAAFRNGVRVVVVSDSCHSGTVVRSFVHRMLSDSPKTRSAYTAVAPALRSRSRGGGQRSTLLRMRGAPPSVQAKVLSQNRDLYRRIRAATPRSRSDETAASVLQIAACEDNQIAMEYGGHGVFTAALVDRWADGAFSGDYRAMVAAIRSDLPATQSPNFLAVGSSWPAFERQQPFTLAAPVADGKTGAVDGEQPMAPAAGVVPLTYRLELSLGADVASVDPALGRDLLDVLRRAARVV